MVETSDGAHSNADKVFVIISDLTIYMKKQLRDVT